MTDSVTERRQMKMHPRLLWDVIHRQAGTLGKAILEGVMNSVDAGASYCELTLDRESFSISDDGKGFASDQEIEQYFETFGYPHEEGDATYGRFRMGRGQIMSFGSSHWETNNYRMDVDFRPQKDEKGDDFALGYNFSKVSDKVKGCSVRVNLYDKLTPSQLDNIRREIMDYVKYVGIPVSLKMQQGDQLVEKVISTPPSDVEWDEETDDGFIKYKASGTLDVYNQGVLVTRLHSSLHGVSGVVVSKTPLDVNFARNNVQSSCAVWKRLTKHLAAKNKESVKRSPVLSDHQRAYLATSLANNEITMEELDDARIVTDVTNSHHKFSVFHTLAKQGRPIVIASRGNRVAEMAHTRKVAFAISDACAEHFGASTEAELVDVIQQIYKKNRFGPPKLRTMGIDDLNEMISSTHEPIEDKELNKAELLALRVIREGNKVLHFGGRYYDYRNGTNVFDVEADPHKSPYSDRDNKRKISVGSSDTALAWTDGTSVIFIERRQLKRVKEGYKGMLALSNLLLHEYLHNGPSTGTHDHGVEFYERFHDLSLRTDILDASASTMLKHMITKLRNENKNVPHNHKSHEDRVVQAADLGIGASNVDVPEVQNTPTAMVATVAAQEKPKKKTERKEPANQLALGF